MINTSESCDDDYNSELVALITKVVRMADDKFKSTVGSSRHWVKECFLPILEANGLVIKEVEK